MNRLKRERNPLVERFLKGRYEEGSFETGIRNTAAGNAEVSKDSRVVCVRGQDSARNL